MLGGDQGGDLPGDVSGNNGDGQPLDAIVPSIAAWARFALTGDPEADAPTDRTFAFFIPSVLANFLLENPCVAAGEAAYAAALNPELLDGPTPTQFADHAAFEEAVGALVAERFLGTPAGVKFVGSLKQIKVGPVTTTTTVTSVDTMKADCAHAAEAARLRISCVRAAILAAPAPTLFGLAGRSRAINEKCGGRYGL